MAKYLVEVTETSQHSWVVEADSKEDAIDAIEHGLDMGYLELTVDDYMEREVDISLCAQEDGTVPLESEPYYDVYDYE